MNLTQAPVNPATARLHEAAYRDGVEQVTVSSEDLRWLLASAAHTHNNETQIAILNIGTSGRGKPVDHEARHQVSVLGQLLGDCIAAAGIIREGVGLTGPELLHFGQDLKTYLDGVDQGQEAYKAVIDYVLANPCESPMEFLRCWNEGSFDSLREEWPDAPKAIYGADSLHPDYKGLGVSGPHQAKELTGITLLNKCRDRLVALRNRAAENDDETGALLAAITAFLTRQPGTEE
uniref:Uncharacterized protein n=1 Tax=Pseudomonas fluorescens (strain SBW25) TaxID=216595 RepID=A0A0G4E5P5_PSEFS|nr:hypothetical protein [Pseudomonas fluorescens]CEK42292.1 hypothetical protein PQBR57_0339 [Pseudomonas fluorescens SBW25]